MDNPCSGWLGDVAWDNITELEKLTNFHGIITSFEQYPRDWNIWYTSDTPETAPLPGNNADITVSTPAILSLFSELGKICPGS